MFSVSSESIKQDIVARLGYVSPFFEAASRTPLVLQNLWLQTKLAHLDSTIPEIFRAQLGTLLSRYSASSYCLMCHSVRLYSLGHSASFIWNLLHETDVSSTSLIAELKPAFLQRQSCWPLQGSELEKLVMKACVAIFLDQEASFFREILRRILTPEDYTQLTLFMSYLQTCLSWTEAHPELNYFADNEVEEHFASLLRDEPRFVKFFTHHRNRRWDVERSKLAHFFAQAPLPLAILNGPEHRFIFANDHYVNYFFGGKSIIGKTLAEVAPEIAAQGFIKLLDSVFTTGESFHGSEMPVDIEQKDGEQKTFIVDFVYQAMRNAHGSIDGIMVVVTDVTARVQARKVLESANRQIASRHKQLMSYFENAPVGIAIYRGASHHFELVNEHYRLITGERNYVGRTIVDVIPEIKDQMLLRILDEVYQSGEPIAQQGIASKLFVEGAWRSRYFDLLFQPLTDELGKTTGILQVVIDVTERVMAKETIQDQQHWLESILNLLPIGLVLLDPKLNKVTFTNEHMKKIVGRSLTDRHIEERYTEDIILKTVDGRIVKNEDLPSSRAARGEVIHDEEMFLETPTGHYNLAVSSESIPKSFGHDESAILLFKDISAMRSAEEQFKAFTELAPQMPFIADASGAIIYFSPQWFKYIGDMDATTGWGWKNHPIHHPDDLTLAIDTWAHAVKTGQSYECAYRLRRFDGVYRWHLGRATAVRDASGKITKWYGTNVDIHEVRMLMEELKNATTQAEAANEAKSAFLANMSHEIRTPLGAILGFTELLKTTSLSGESRDFLHVIERNGHALTRVIDDILDLSKVESGQLILETVDFSLRELLSDVLTLFVEKAKSKGITIQLDDTRPIPDRILSDPTRLRQILINLVGNAVKFTSVGRVTISVKHHKVHDTEHHIQFYVADTGPGLSQEQSQRLFMPFMQADESTSRRFGGTGLGLALSRRLARVLGGDVTIPSTQVGVGSVFMFELSVTNCTFAPTQTLPHNAPEKPLGRLHNLRILVVDDASDNRVLIRAFLKREGALVSEAEDGAKALEKAGQSPFDLVLMDIQMPGLDGYETLAQLRQRGFQQPVLALTAHAMLEERLKTKRAGFQAHVTKPIDRETLIQALVTATAEIIPRST